MKSTADKREREKRMVSEMIALYCRKKHHTKGGLCPECADLEAYARMRSDKCPFMETKTFCSNCKVHCYKPVMREKIREVMRFSGPRMLFFKWFLCTFFFFSTCVDVYFNLITTQNIQNTTGGIKVKIKKLLYVILGCIGLALGAVGAVLPLLPAFPFLLLAAFCFAKSSEKLHRWFTGTKLYKNNQESYVK